MQHDDDDCDCPTDPKWFLLAIAILPVILPPIVERLADAFYHKFKPKKHSKKEEQEDDDHE